MKHWNQAYLNTRRTIATFYLFISTLGNSLMAQAEDRQLAEHQLSQPEKCEGLTVQLISDQSVIETGKPFRVGLHIHHDEGYHTYWKQPGVVGMATSFKWSLPDGFTISEVSWPYPELSDMAGYPCHGYERDVTLFATITPPKSLPMSELKIGLESTWMCCAKNCFPGFQDFAISLPVGKKSEQHKQYFSLIEKASKEVPTHSNLWQTKLLSKAGAEEIVLEIAATDPSIKADKAYLFSSDGQVSSDKPQVLQKETNGKWLLTVSRSELSPKDSKTLPAILKINSSYIRLSPTYSQ